MSKTIFNIASEDEMRALSKAIARNLAPGMVVLFFGDLGVGKSFLIRAILRAYTDNEGLDVPSPSFTLIQEYELNETTLHHIDLYRLGGEDDLYELGIPDIFDGTISLIEWPERLGAFAPDNAVIIAITDQGETARQVEIKGIEVKQ